MKFSVSSTNLQKTLTKISGVVPSKSTLPILENVLLDLRKNTLRVAATDLEMSMSDSLEVKGSEDGSLAVPAKRLMDTVRSLPEVEIIFTADLSANRIKMITNTGEYQLMGEPGHDFPGVPEFKAETKVPLDGSLLKRIIQKTVFSVSADELRPAMTGVLLQFMDTDLRAVATDGHRLVRYHIKDIQMKGLRRDVVIPGKALSLILRGLEDGSHTLHLDSTHIQFQFGTTTLTSRLIEEKYPNYESVIPGDNTKVLTVDRDTVLAAVRRVALYSSATTHQIRFSLKKDELRVAAEDVDFGGEAREKIACSYADEEMEIGFNSSYIIDVLSHIDNEEVVLKLSTPVRAAIVSPREQRPGEDVLMLVMPVRLNS